MCRWLNDAFNTPTVFVISQMSVKQSSFMDALVLAFSTASDWLPPGRIHFWASTQLGLAQLIKVIRHKERFLFSDGLESLLLVYPAPTD